MSVYLAVVSSAAYTFFDDGVGNFLGLETLRHGTNFWNYLRIRLYGGDPAQGGKASGATLIQHYTKNQFFLLRDNDYPPPDFSDPQATILDITPFSKRLMARQYSALSGLYLFVNKNANIANSDSEIEKVMLKACYFVGEISALVHFIAMPTLKFRFTPEESKVKTKKNQRKSKRFHLDPRSHNQGCYTTKKIEPWRVGIIGSLVTGLNSQWISRVKENPSKFFTGIIQLTCAAALAKIAFSATALEPNFAIPVAIGILLS